LPKIMSRMPRCARSTKNRVLEAVAARLKDCLRAEDTVSRFGGDEFVVLLPSLQSAEDAVHVVQKITSSLAAPLWIEERKMSVTASVGISLFPADGRDAGYLLEKADAAMYKAKKDRAADAGEIEKKPV
jgi:diguanylate cyclase (GGDEF)-like protein